ncbi:MULTISPECIES: hypothetical protein [unclassified Nonomuraea]|uniref:hypothetical protein n=1 Tax=unclassified Nonomuraea TaxID=2593643 RepID=UPI00340FB9CA
MISSTIGAATTRTAMTISSSITLPTKLDRPGRPAARAQPGRRVALARAVHQVDRHVRHA